MNDKYDTVEPLGFKDFSQLGHVEKDLENLLATNLLDVFFEENQLMPIFQERARQEEADIYALNQSGDLVVFELKRAVAGSGAVHQALRYCEHAAPWDYAKLQKRYHTYICKNNPNLEEVNLQEEHRENFNLDKPLDKDKFNQQQHLMIVGSAANASLMQTIDYWKKQGLSIDFLPYRVYEINNELYFEFFSLPYDIHSNPAYVKGFIFDTCKTYYDKSVGYMCENSRVAAFGGQKRIIYRIQKNDIVFLYNRGQGIIAAGKVKSNVNEDADLDALYRDIEWLTNKPVVENLNPMPVWVIKETLGHNFFWARTIKTPYLSKEESELLLTALNKYQNKGTE